MVIGELYFPTTKVFKVGGDLLGITGNADYSERFLEWYKKQQHKPPKLDDKEFEALVVTKTGIYHYGALCVPVKVDRDFEAIGSGALGALIAMKDGADPKTAIEKVSDFENNTSRETDTLEL